MEEIMQRKAVVLGAGLLTAMSLFAACASTVNQGSSASVSKDSKRGLAVEVDLESTETFSIPELDLEVIIPADWWTITRDSVSFQQELEAANISIDAVRNAMPLMNTYLGAYIPIKNGKLPYSSCFEILGGQNPMAGLLGDYRDLDDKTLNALSESEKIMLEKTQDAKASGTKFTAHSVFRGKNCAFRIFDTEGSIPFSWYKRQYLTAWEVAGKWYNYSFVFTSIDGPITAEQDALIRAIVDLALVKK
jgi:hypothetical protein